MLAGGRSSRMGQNKALMIFKGNTMLLHVIERVQTVAEETIAVIGFQQEVRQYRDAIPKDIPIIRDSMNLNSPLVGIMTGTEYLGIDYVSIHPCDTPFVEPKLIEHLFSRAQAHDAAIAVTADARIQPLNSVYNASAVHRACQESLREGRSRCREMIRRLQDVIYVRAEELMRFDPRLATYLNINTKEEFRELSKMSIRSQALRREPWLAQA